MYTDLNYRRLGIATELLDRVVKEAKEYGWGHSIDVKEKYIKPTRVFELEDGVGIYRNRRR